jgi:hypothetical protein
MDFIRNWASDKLSPSITVELLKRHVNTQRCTTLAQYYLPWSGLKSNWFSCLPCWARESKLVNDNWSSLFDRSQKANQSSTRCRHVTSSSWLTKRNCILIMLGTISLKPT